MTLLIVTLLIKLLPLICFFIWGPSTMVHHHLWMHVICVSSLLHSNRPFERVLDRGQRHGGHGALVAVEHGLAPARRVAQQAEGGEGGRHVEPQPDVQRRVLQLQGGRGKWGK